MNSTPPLALYGRHDPEHEVFEVPSDPEARIWRYLDFTKLVSLLDTGRLFFAATSSFEDPFEGSYPTPNLAERERFWRANSIDSSLPNFAEFARNLPSWVFASCWNLSDVENAAFWRLYVPSAGGVAIRSSYRRFVQSLRDPDPGASEEEVMSVNIGCVNYMEYERDLIPEGNALYPFVHKRRSFAFEQELRAVAVRFPDAGESGSVDFASPGPAGLAIAVDLAILIEAIYVSPSAPPWFTELVNSVVARYECAAPVIQSSMSAEPLF